MSLASTDETAARCRACGSTDEGVVVWTSRNIREGLSTRGAYVRCNSCHSLNLRPVPTAEELARAYDSVAMTQPGIPARRKGLRALLRGWFPNPHEAPGRAPAAGRRLLDVGCGAGGKLRRFQELGWDCYGTDISPQAIAHASEVVPKERLFAGVLAQAPFQEHTFDVVRTDNVIEHLLMPATDLTEARRFLRPGGHLYVYVPHADGLLVRLFRAAAISSWIPFHLTLFSVEGLKALLARAGFTDVDISSYGPPDWFELTADQYAEIHHLGSGARSASRGVARGLSRPLGLASSWAMMGDELIARATL